MADRSEVDAKASSAYAEIGGGTNLRDLIKAVKTAQTQKGRQLSKKELKAKAAVAKAEAAASAQAQAQAAMLAALEAEAAQAKLEAQQQAAEARAAETRTRREAAVAAERARRNAQATKIKDLKRTVDRAIGVALKSVTAQQINDITRLQASLKSAWAALPPAMQYAEDREKLIENDQIIDDLRAIYQQQQDDAKAKTQTVAASVQESQAQTRDSFAEAWAATKRLGGDISSSTRKGYSTLLGLGRSASTRVRTVSGLAGSALLAAGRSGVDTGKAIGNAVMAPPRMALGAVKAVASGIKTVAEKLGQVKDSTKEWFDKRFGNLFRKIWSVLRAPFAIAKNAGNFLSKALGWGMLLTSVLAPIIKGLYKELADKFSLDYINERFREFKDWAFERIASFFSFLKDGAVAGYEKGKEFVKSIPGHAQAGYEKGKDALSGITKPLMGIPNAGDTGDKSDLGQLKALFESYKQSSNPAAKSMYAWQIRKHLTFMDPNAVPDDLSKRLVAEGFQPQSKNTKFAKALAAKPAASSKVTTATATPAPADSGSAKPVVATPPSKSFSEMSGQGSMSKQGSSPGLGVGQIPRALSDESLFAFNTGALSGGL